AGDGFGGLGVAVDFRSGEAGVDRLRKCGHRNWDDSGIERILPNNASRCAHVNSLPYDNLKQSRRVMTCPSAPRSQRFRGSPKIGLRIVSWSSKRTYTSGAAGISMREIPSAIS